ncbi:MAG: amidohydrolase family protein [Verrucomicrobia bacterium]|nr:amidohydrolase family protein [Verrucomicrobiota bacterium]MBI3869547.1 amidohydrolase family protein [Verrucomicrobiota bacterium]
MRPRNGSDRWNHAVRAIYLGVLLLCVGPRGLRAGDAPASDPLKDMPIVDIHTHTFNAYFLPLENIILGRRDALPPLTWLLSDRGARELAHSILAIADENELSGGNAGVRRRSAQDPKVAAAESAQRAADHYNLEHPEENRTRRQMQNASAHKLVENALARRARLQSARRLGPGQLLWLRVLRSLMRHADRDPDDSLAAFGEFVERLTLPEEKLVTQFQKDHGVTNIFMVSHMMDMGPTYNQHPDPFSLMDVQQQIHHMRAQQTSANGAMAYFVAFSPYRNHWEARATNGRALSVVTNALMRSHALGVKVYPPAGYRPAHNEIPKRPFALFTSQPRKQWEARYMNHGKRLDGAELDAEMLEMLTWCARNDIPVFAHCNSGEFQARSGYGERMADPQWWRELLETRSAAYPELLNLRLCLGHAGGPNYWFRERHRTVNAPDGTPAHGAGLLLGSKKAIHPDPFWGSNVVHLCTRYTNVYCEVGILDELTGKRSERDHFEERFSALLKRDGTPDHPLPFADKILYGSDWFMPLSHAQDRSSYLASYQELLKKQGNERYVKFFLANAIRFLNVEARARSTAFPLDRRVKDRLLELDAEAKKREQSAKSKG